jgi:hypothetical protein
MTNPNENNVVDFTDKDVAEWMFHEIKNSGYLLQIAAIIYIKKKFGQSFIYKNEDHSDEISTTVLKEFAEIRKKFPQKIEWNRARLMWVLRKESDRKF